MTMTNEATIDPLTAIDKMMEQIGGGEWTNETGEALMSALELMPAVSKELHKIRNDSALMLNLFRIIRMTNMIVLNHLDDPFRCKQDLDMVQELIDEILTAQ